MGIERTQAERVLKENQMAMVCADTTHAIEAGKLLAAEFIVIVPEKTTGQAVIEALRRFLDSHRPELVESQILADVQWGLHGSD